MITGDGRWFIGLARALITSRFEEMKCARAVLSTLQGKNENGACFDCKTLYCLFLGLVLFARA